MGALKTLISPPLLYLELISRISSPCLPDKVDIQYGNIIVIHSIQVMYKHCAHRHVFQMGHIE